MIKKINIIFSSNKVPMVILYDLVFLAVVIGVKIDTSYFYNLFRAEKEN